MGYLGSSLDDYYSYQLLEKVIAQVESGSTGDMEKLVKRLDQLTNLIKVRDKDFKKCAWAIVDSGCVGGDKTDYNGLVEILRDHFG